MRSRAGGLEAGSGAMPPIRGSALTLVSCSIRICGPVSSARASAIDLGTSGLGGGGAGLVATADEAACEGGARSRGAARAVLSLSPRLYQHLALGGAIDAVIPVVAFGRRGLWTDRQSSAGLAPSSAPAANSFQPESWRRSPR